MLAIHSHRMQLFPQGTVTNYQPNHCLIQASAAFQQSLDSALTCCAFVLVVGCSNTSVDLLSIRIANCTFGGDKRLANRSNYFIFTNREVDILEHMITGRRYLKYILHPVAFLYQIKIVESKMIMTCCGKAKFQRYYQNVLKGVLFEVQLIT